MIDEHETQRSKQNLVQRNQMKNALVPCKRNWIFASKIFVSFIKQFIKVKAHPIEIETLEIAFK